ncbi:MAG: hypothetical protein H6696_16810 [Deferribacteres bacterium]|nr:hypothetical protein [candidate division KSB1 bacterium]MCB9503595.1 hypothetical protein [Deferribacteres bacterium]
MKFKLRVEYKPFSDKQKIKNGEVGITKASDQNIGRKGFSILPYIQLAIRKTGSKQVKYFTFTANYKTKIKLANLWRTTHIRTSVT